MSYVTGLGGVFFRARDPQGLGKWYRDHLGIDVMAGPDGAPWHQAEGPTVFAPFAQDTDYFGRDSQQWMLNFRVSDLDALCADLRAAGVEVVTNPDWDSEVGQFARLHDPEGNPIELWQPAAPPGD